MSLAPVIQAIILQTRDHWWRLPDHISVRRRQHRNAYMRGYMRSVRQRSHSLSIVLTDEQYRRLTQEAQAVGRKPTTCFRDAAFAYFDRRILLPSAYIELIAEAIGEIRRIGNNINQLAYRANVRGRTAGRDLQQARQLLQELEAAIASRRLPQPLPPRP